MADLAGCLETLETTQDRLPVARQCFDSGKLALDRGNADLIKVGKVALGNLTLREPATHQFKWRKKCRDRRLGSRTKARRAIADLNHKMQGRVDQRILIVTDFHRA